MYSFPICFTHRWQHFEKLTSGMYLGEIVRLALVDLQQSVGIFSGGDVKIFQRLVLT